MLTLSCQANFLVKVTGVRNTKGDIRLVVFDQQEGFPSTYQKAKIRKSLPASQAKNGVLTFQLKEIRLANCAFVILHDENSNKKMDRNFLKMPKEGAAISNGLSLRPSFQKAVVKNPKSPVLLKVQYL